MDDPVSRAAERVLGFARVTTGFMPEEEGMALFRAARSVLVDRSVLHSPRERERTEAGEASSVSEDSAGSTTRDTGRRGAVTGPLVEIGAYCGKSTLYLAAALVDARDSVSDAILLSVDHHRGSEENQQGWEHHDSTLADPRTGRIDTLPYWRHAVTDAGVEDLVVGVVGDSAIVARLLGVDCRLVFIDGGHGSVPAWADYRSWSRRVAVGGLLAIHDVFANPLDGGRPPYEIYCAAIDSGAFVEEDLSCGSLAVLRCVARAS